MSRQLLTACLSLLQGPLSSTVSVVTGPQSCPTLSVLHNILVSKLVGSQLVSWLSITRKRKTRLHRMPPLMPKHPEGLGHAQLHHHQEQKWPLHHFPWHPHCSAIARRQRMSGFGHLEQKGVMPAM